MTVLERKREEFSILPETIIIFQTFKFLGPAEVVDISLKSPAVSGGKSTIHATKVSKLETRK